MSPEAALAFQTATHFHEAAVRCSEKAYPNPEDETIHVSVLIPAIVCTAFAAELYLKALLLRRGESAKSEHRLGELFHKKLNDEERDAIAAHYEARRGARRDRMYREIEEFSKAFVEWRYSHELPRSIDFAALTQFAQSAYLAIRDLAPEWNAGEYLNPRILDNENVQVFFGNTAENPADFMRKWERSIWAQKIQLGQPQPDVIKGEEYNFSLAAPSLNLDGKAATLNVNVRRGSDAKDGSADEPIK